MSAEKPPLLCRWFGHNFGKTAYSIMDGLFGKGLYSCSICKRCKHAETSMTETFPMGTFEIKKVAEILPERKGK